jgi:hypothetical protein
MGRIKSGSAHSSGQIPPPRTDKSPDSLVFSFKHLDLTTNPKFMPAKCKDGYIAKLLERLKALHGFSVSELKTNKSKALRCHLIDWKDTSERGGFTFLNPQLRDCQAWQFEVSSNEHGRVHGLFLDCTFYVIWIDPDHLLYP